VEGTPLITYLRTNTLGPRGLFKLTERMHDGLEHYTAATGEPLYDFHVRNCMLDAESERLGIIDFGIPDQFAGGTQGLAPVDLSLGNLVGSAIYEAARPYQVLHTRRRRQMMALVATVARSFRPATDGGRPGT